MSYGSNIAVEDAEDEYREETARLIAMHAAELVAARDMTRDAAITAAVEHQRYCQEAERDPTGTVATLDEAQRPQPSRSVSDEPIKDTHVSGHAHASHGFKANRPLALAQQARAAMVFDKKLRASLMALRLGGAFF